MFGVKTWFISLHSLSFDLFWEYFSIWCFCWLLLLFSFLCHVVFESGVITTVKKPCKAFIIVHLSWNTVRLFSIQKAFHNRNELWTWSGNFFQRILQKLSLCNSSFDHALRQSKHTPISSGVTQKLLKAFDF